MKATGSSVYKTRQALAILKAWLRMPTRLPCQHPRWGKAKNVHIFIKDGHLATPKETEKERPTKLADFVVACASPTCEKVKEVRWHGLTSKSATVPQGVDVPRGRAVESRKRDDRPSTLPKPGVESPSSWA